MPLRRFLSAPIRLAHALALVCLVAPACDAGDTGAAVHTEIEGRVNLVTEDGVSLWFIDAGTNISVVELVPEGRESVAEAFIADGVSAHELFQTLAPADVELPALLDSAQAHRPVDGDQTLAARGMLVEGLYSSCPGWDGDDWEDFVETAHSGYDDYYHVTNSKTNLTHDSYAGARRYFATMCTIHTHMMNTPPDDVINYQGWRRTVGGTWSKLVDIDVPQSVRVRHWDDPGSDGWQWRVAVKEVPPPAGCSFVCNPGKHHTSQMWDWN